MGSPAVGIDLGTSNCVVAYVHNGSPRIVPAKDGSKVTPSWVHISKDEVLVGAEAREHSIRDPLNTYNEWKRLLGRTSNEVRRELQRLRYNVRQTSDGLVEVECPCRGTTLPPHMLSAELLRHLLHQAKQELGEQVRKAVITIPANCSTQTRQAVKLAARAAGVVEVVLLQGRAQS